MLPLIFILSLISCCIEIDISVPSFPDMAKGLGVSDTMVQLTIASNFLGFCLAALLHGPLSESYGRRPVMVGGNFLLLMGAMGCVFASSIYELIGWRFLQGIGASTSAVVTFAMIADLYDGPKSVRLIGLMNSIFSMVIAIAPLLGSLINEVIGWRGNYGVVALISLVSWITLFLKLPESKNHKTPFSWAKIGQDYRLLFTHKRFMLSCLIPSLLYAAYLSFVTCSSFLYMQALKVPPFPYACHQATIIGSFSLVSLLSGFLARHWKTRFLIISGVSMTLLAAFGLGSISLFCPDSPTGITLCMILFGIGFALCYPLIFTASLEIFPDLKGTASSAIMSLRALLCSTCVGLVGMLYKGGIGAIACVISGIVLVISFMIRHVLKD